ncbi:uncharacterized protein LOC8273421 isoform X2 [Ricinus communis]|uniref:uncharacterized protein LOC8273421 isoform X2 n=1 Tax=Ricinus communis TaxID=3988 RepID=UPI00201AEF18|nr:uncharacterized protein LOC8273421 isoform X2 [Ricinus communis]
MNQAIRLIRTQNPSAASIFSFPSSRPINQGTSAVGFRKVTTFSSNPDNKHDMEKAQNPNEKTGDVMSHSFGEGYATRSDEEGFGGIYGGNQSVVKEETDKEIHENHPVQKYANSPFLL